MKDLVFADETARITRILPDTAQRYLDHTANGCSIREIARQTGYHPSTILRQIRKIETLREDLIVDRALAEPDPDGTAGGAAAQALIHGLRPLCEPGAVMVYAQDAQEPVVTQLGPNHEMRVLAKLSLRVAVGLLMRGWVDRFGGTSLHQYRITEAGRRVLPELMAIEEMRAAYGEADISSFTDDIPDRRSRDHSVSNGPGFESPLATLARRKDTNGEPFLNPEMVAAGERLFEDFSVSSEGQPAFPTGETPDILAHLAHAQKTTSSGNQSAAIQRTMDALADLGPGLGDAVPSCCCLREGLEATEKRLGWSARSGKVVLRIALQRLTRFYQSAHGHSALIG